MKYRKLIGLKRDAVTWSVLPDDVPLSVILNGNLLCSAPADTIHFVGSDAKMTREWMTEPNDKGWKFANSFVFKNRVATYEKALPTGRVEIGVKLINHRNGWLPGCEDYMTAVNAWRALESEWKSTGLPLLSSPAATGTALLWESLPHDAKTKEPIEFPALSDDLATLVRANSPQHRIEWFQIAPEHEWDQKTVLSRCVQYDGRWMYAAMCGLDRFPVGEPHHVGGFREYIPGIYDVTIRVPKDWNHIGLIPMKLENTGWVYPFTPGRTFRAWVFEPELTLAIKNKWEICEVHDGYAWEKGRPLASWSAKLIEMRQRLQAVEINAMAFNVDDAEVIGSPRFAPYKFAAAAIRQILNHTIGAMHRNDYEREEFVPDSEWRDWKRRYIDKNGYFPFINEEVEGGKIVRVHVPDTSPLSIFMPHWSSTVYSLARARVAEWALKCAPSTLVKINGDAIYSTIEQPDLDKLDEPDERGNKRLGRPRRK